MTVNYSSQSPPESWLPDQKGDVSKMWQRTANFNLPPLGYS